MVRLATRLSGGGDAGLPDPNQTMGTDLTGFWQVGELTVDDGAGKLVSLGNQATSVTKTLTMSGTGPVIELTGGPNSQPRVVFASTSGVLENASSVELSPSGGALHVYVLWQVDKPTLVQSQQIAFRSLGGATTVYTAAYINSFRQSKYLSPANKSSLLASTSTAHHLLSTEWDGITTRPKADNVYMDAGQAMSGTQSDVTEVLVNFSTNMDDCGFVCMLTTKVKPTTAQHAELIAWFNDVYDLGLPA